MEDVIVKVKFGNNKWKENGNKPETTPSVLVKDILIPSFTLPQDISYLDSRYDKYLQSAK